MNSKKGFTLVELIGVIVLIGIIALIAIPSVDYLIKKTKDNAYDRTLDTIIDGLRNWTTDNKELMYEDGTEIILTLADLKEQGYVDFDIKNPKTNACLDNTMEFKITKVKDEDNDKYEFEILNDELLDGNSDDCEALTRTPSIYLLGDNPQKIEITDNNALTYETNYDSGAVAKNANGEDISGRISINSNVNLQEVSKDYQVRYSIIDNGISKTVIRKVYVVDTTAPVLNVPEDLEIYLDETLDLMEGVSATDNSGEEVTIKTSGNVNFNRVGDYKVTYIATDSSGNKTSKERIIKVIKPYYILKRYTENEDIHHPDYINNIVTITFKDNNTIPEDAVVTWDMSEAKNNTIIGYLVRDEEAPEYYHVYIGSRGYIRANPISNSWFSGLTNLMKITFDNYDTTNVTSMVSMFHNCQSLIDLDVTGFNTSKVTTMRHMFNNVNKLVELEVSGFQTSSLTDMFGTFQNTKSLQKLSVSDWDVSKVTTFQYTFYGASSLTELDVSNWDVKSAISFSYMFSNLKDMKRLNIDNWNLESAKYIDSMFRGSINLEELNVSNWNTSNVINMASTFSGLKKIKVLDVSDFDTSNVTHMYNTFSGDIALETLDVSNWNVANVKYFGSPSSRDYGGVFENCSNLKTIDVSNWDTSSALDMSNMFNGTSSVEELEVSNFDTSNVIDMTHMFHGTNKISLDLSNWNTSSALYMNYMFAHSEFDTINLTNLETNNVIEMVRMFSRTIVNELDLSSFDTSNVTSMSGIFEGTNTNKLNISTFNFANVMDDNTIFGSFSNNDCLIIVKDQTTKDWILGINSEFTNIQIAS